MADVQPALFGVQAGEIRLSGASGLFDSLSPLYAYALGN